MADEQIKRWRALIREYEVRLAEIDESDAHNFAIGNKIRIRIANFRTAIDAYARAKSG